MQAKSCRRRNLTRLALAATLALGAGNRAHAASAVWDGSQNTGTWSDTANWTPVATPGTGDTATFNGAGGTVDVIDLGLGVTISTILFDTSAVAAYTIGAGAVNSQTLTLNNSGAITANSTINANQTFNAALVLGTDATAQSYTITNSDASNSLTFAGTITGGSTGTAGIKTLNVNTAAGGVTLGGNITAGGATAIALTKTGTGTLTLNGANTLGDVTVSDGTLFTEKSMTFGNLSVAASKTFQFGAGSAAYTININGLSGAGTVTTANSGGFQRNLTLGNNDATADFSGVLTQAGNRALVLTKLGAGTQTLSGSVANTQGGGTGVGFDTYVSAGSLVLNKTAAIALPGDVFINGGTLQLSGTGDNQIADTSAVSWSSGTFDLNGRSETIGAFSVSVLSASANQINIAAGKTFTAAGNVNIFNSAATTLGTNVTFNSAGSVPTSTFAVTGASSFIFGQDSTTSSTTRTNTLDMRNLGVFNAGTSGTALTNFVIGNYVQATGGNYNDGGINTAYLAPSSTIYSTAFGVGDKASGQPGNHNNTLYLGSGTTALHATTITVGEVGAISTGSTVKWNTGVTTGTLTLNGTGVTSAVTDMFVGYKTDTASSSAGTRLGTVDLSNGTVTGNITNLYVGYKTTASDSGSSPATTTGVFKLGAGTAGASSNLTIGNLTLGYSVSTASTRDNPVNGTFQLDGGSVSVTNNVALTNESLYDTRSGTLTINGGVMTIGGNITAGVTKATSTLTLSGGTLDMTAGTIGTLANPIDTFTINPGTAATLKNVASINGTGGITKTGAGTLTLAGTMGYTGATAINAGTLLLDYASSDTTKLSDTAALTLGGVTVELSGGTHTEIVGSTVLTANTDSTITRSSGTATLQLNTITRNAGATINFTTGSIASTDTTNTNGILGTWATVGGTDWATNSTDGADGLITAYTGYTDVTRLESGTKVIPNTSTANVRVIDGTGTTPANLTLAAATTTVNTLLQSATGGTATIDPNSQILGVGGILVGSGASTLTIGTGTNNGTLRAASAGGELVLNNESVNSLTINSLIANNTTASPLIKDGSGTAIVTGANTFTGATLIYNGTLRVGQASGASTTATLFTSSGITNNGTLIFRRTNGSAVDLAGAINGTGSVSYEGTGVSNESQYTVNDASTYSGGTTISNSRAAVSVLTGLGTGLVTINSGGQVYVSATSGIVANDFSIAGDGWLETAGRLGALRLNGTTVSGDVTMTANSRIATSSTSTISGVVSGGFALEAGEDTATGKLVLSNSNTYTGTTTVSFGQLNIQHASALGTTANGTSVSSGAALELQGGISFAAEALTLNGTGSSSGGALRNISGDNTYTGAITLGSAARINSDSGTLTLNVASGNAIAATNLGLTFGGAGNITVNDPIATGSGTVTKDGAGTLTLSGTNTYTGATAVSAGTLTVSGVIGSGGGTAVTTSGTSAFNVNNTNGLTGTSSLTVGTGTTATLFAANNYSGATSVTGTLQLRNAASTGTSAVTMNSGSTLQLRADADTTFSPASIAVAGTGTVTYNYNVDAITGGTTGKTLTLANVATQWGPASTTDTFNVSGGAGSGYTLAMGSGASGTGALNIWNNTTVNSNTAGVTLQIAGGLNVNFNSNYTLAFGGAGDIKVGALVNNQTSGGQKNLTPTFGGSGTIQLNGANNFGAATGTISTTGTLKLNNAAALTGLSTLTISGAATIDNITASAITLAGNPAQNWNSNFTFGGTQALNLGTGAVAMNASRQVTVNGSGSTGVLTVGGIISGSGFSLTKAGTGTLTLSGANTFNGGLTIKAGTIVGKTSASAFGGASGAVTLGDTTGTAAASLLAGSATTFANPIALAANVTSGTLTIGSDNSNTAAVFSGGVTGTNNLTLANGGSASLTFNTVAINNAGTVTNAGSGAGSLSIAIGFGANVTDVIQNSTTSTLSIASGITSLNTGDTYIKAGTLQLAGPGGGTSITPLNTGSIYLGNTSGSSAATLAFGNTNILANPIVVQSNSNASTKAINVSASGVPVFSGGVTLNDNLDITTGSSTGLTIQTGDVTINNNSTLSFKPSATNAATFTISSNITGSGGNLLFGGTTSGTPTYVLSGSSNTYSGTTTINKGIVKINAANKLGDGSVTNTITLGGGTLESTANTYSLGTNRTISLTNATNSVIQNGAGVLTVDGVISGGGSLTIGSTSVTGNVILTGNNLFTGNVVLGGSNNTFQPKLTITNTGALGVGPKSVTTNNANSATNGIHLQNNITLASNISWVTSGSAITNDSGDNIINGNISLAAGNGNTTITSTGGSLTFNGTMTPTANGRQLILQGAGDISLSNTIADGTGNNILVGVQKNSGAGTVTLGGTNTYTSNTLVSAGTLAISSDSNLGETWTGSIQKLTFTSAGTGLSNGTVALTISAPDLPGGVQATGTATVSGGVITAVTLTDAGSGYSNAPTIANLTGTTNGAIAANVANLSIGAATLQTNAAVTSSRAVTLSGGIATINTNNFDSTFSGPFTGTGALTKSGAGTLTLSGANTYTGATTVAAGVLAIAGSGSLATGSAVSVTTGGELRVDGTVNGTLAVDAASTLSGTGGTVVGAADVDGHLAPGASPGTLAFTSNLTLSSTTILDWEFNGADQTVGGAVNDLVSVGGSLTLDGTLDGTLFTNFASVTSGSWRLFNYTGGLTNNTLALQDMPALPSGYNFSIDTATAGQVNLTVVPEPSTTTLGLLAAAGLLMRRRRSA